MSSSIKKYQCQPNILLNIAKMRFDNDGMQTIVVEGETDYRLFRQWLIERNARIENVDGKSNVKEIWRKAKERRFISIHCIADLDFDLVLKDNPIIDDQFIYVSIKEGNSESDIECNDLESALIRSHSLTKVMSQKYRGLDLYQDFEVRIEELREQLRIAARNLGAYRAADQLLFLTRKISAIGGNFAINEDFYDSINVNVDSEKLSSLLRRGSNLSGYGIEEVISNATKLSNKYSTGWQLCRGHDLTEMLALHVSNIVKRNVTVREIEEDLRMACELEMINSTRFGARLLNIGKVNGRPLLGLSPIV